MNIILVGKHHGQARTFQLGPGKLLGAAVLAFMLVVALFMAGFLVARGGDQGVNRLMDRALVEVWQHRLQGQRDALAELDQETQRQLDALTMRLGDLQARMLRVDALGQRLVEASQLDRGEFDFVSAPAVGGPAHDVEEAFSVPDLTSMIARLDAQMGDREQQLTLLDELLANRQIADETFVAGRPVTSGWLSSRFGYRSDPFSGKRSWHGGVDFAGRVGSDVVAVAAGVVIAAERHAAYGNMVDIDHGDGLMTRYAHCDTLAVSVGDIVQKGQVIASLGSSGRATGPHVHFEVHKKGVPQNPERYIHRAAR